MKLDRQAHILGLPKFWHPEHCRRVTSLLETTKGREKFRNMLPHNFVADPMAVALTPKGPAERAATLAELTKLGAPALCYVVSEKSTWDDKVMELKEFVLGDLIGSEQGTLVSCIAGRLAYFNGEEHHQRFIIFRKACAVSDFVAKQT